MQMLAGYKVIVRLDLSFTRSVQIDNDYIFKVKIMSKNDRENR